MNERHFKINTDPSQYCASSQRKIHKWNMDSKDCTIREMA